MPILTEEQPERRKRIGCGLCLGVALLCVLVLPALYYLAWWVYAFFFAVKLPD